MTESSSTRLSIEEIEAQDATLLPAKEVVSLLDLNVLLDLGIDLTAPIDLAVAANANVAAPINAGVSADVLSFASSSGALAHHESSIGQTLDADAIATAPQHAVIDQTSGLPDGDGVPDPVVPAPVTTSGLLDGPLLNVNVDVDLDANVSAPIAGAVAVNANVAAPINASASANIASFGSESTAIAEQYSVINQSITGVAQATALQDAEISQ
jgi:hypothetical protein